jgi:hypothetical protein
MLYAKAAGEVARKIAPDVLAGVPHSVEDLELEDQPTAKVTRAPRTDAREPKPAPVEPEFDEPAQEPVKATAERTDNGISDAQLKAVNAGLTALGIKDRDAKLAMVSQIIDREIESSKDLTRAEASVVINWIKTEESNAPAEPPLDGDWPDVKQADQ